MHCVAAGPVQAGPRATLERVNQVVEVVCVVCALEPWIAELAVREDFSGAAPSKQLCVLQEFGYLDS